MPEAGRGVRSMTPCWWKLKVSEYFGKRKSVLGVYHRNTIPLGQKVKRIWSSIVLLFME